METAFIHTPLGIAKLEGDENGLASITLCEAYAMTKDPQLAPFAQGTVWYIEDAQDPIGGGVAGDRRR